jgi:hypothetical protein
MTNKTTKNGAIKGFTPKNHEKKRAKKWQKK